MSNITLATMRSYVELRAQDVDQTISAADKLTIINKWYHLWTDEVDPRVVSESGTTFSGQVNTGANSFDPAGTYYAEVIRVTYNGVNSSTTTGTTEMERIELTNMLRLISVDAQTTGTPSMWALERIQSASGPGLIRIYIRPGPTTNHVYFGAHVKKWVTALSGDTDKPDVADPDAYRIALLAASEVAWLLGKPPDFVQGIISEVGDKGEDMRARVMIRRWQNVVAPKGAPQPQGA